MKKLLFALSLSFLFLISCSSENNKDESCSSYLECYDGTDWKWDDGQGYLIYYRILNNPDNPFKIYLYNDYDFDPPCMEVYNVSAVNFNITENIPNRLVVQVYDSSTKYSFYTFELKNGVMSLTVVEYENNTIVDEDYSVLFEESVSKSNIPICN